MKDTSKSEASAMRRLELLGPLLNPNLDPGKFQALKRQVVEHSGLSERTIRRYLNEYQELGLDGLKTKSRGRPRGSTIAGEVLAEAILLRREVPGRSVSQIIDILESEGMALPGTLKRSTLQEYFQSQGYSARQMRLYESVSGHATRRFQHRNRNDLWQSDIKYGIYLPIGKGGTMQQTYLVTFLDDATRNVVHAEFYAALDQSIVEDAFRSAIIKWGAPKAVFFDNGKQYRNKWMRDCCEQLGIRLLYAKPYSAASKGKVEKFNRLAENFLTEERLDKPATLTELNLAFAAWLSECYQHKTHSALKDQMSPHLAYQRDKTPLRFIAPEQLSKAFLHREQRRVDKAGCISLKGKKYDVGWQALGKKVTVTYDPKDIREIHVTWGNDTWSAKELHIGSRCGPKPKLPVSLEIIQPKESRVLKSASTKHAKRIEGRKQAISYSAMEDV
jgi:transposase InsO family protein